MIDNRTPNLDLPLPNVNNLMKSEDVPRLRDAITLLDQAVSDRVTQAELDAAIAALLGNAPPAALDTLNELAAAINDDANFAATVTAQLATKLSAVPTATSVVLGGVKVGSGLTVAPDGTLSTTGAGSGTGLPSFAEIIMTPTSNGQTAFTPAGGYVAGQIELYLNGVLLIGNGDDYTASNGTTITLTVGANTVDKLLLRKWYYLPVETTVNKTGDTMTGPLSVPSGASGTQVPRAEEVVKKAGDNMSGALNELKAANISAAATTNVWSLAGNSATLTGTTTITSFGTAPQAGAKRTLIAGAATPLTHGANLQLPGGANYTTTAGDRLEIYAETTTQHRVSIFKADGTAVVANGSGLFDAIEVLNISADTSLTAASKNVVRVASTVRGSSVKLPAGTALSGVTGMYVVKNIGDFALPVRDQDGTLLSILPKGATGIYTLEDASTSAGVWGVIAPESRPAQAFAAATVEAATTNWLGVSEIPGVANKALLAWITGSSMKVAIATRSASTGAVTVGTPLTLITGLTHLQSGMIKALTATTALAAGYNGATAVYSLTLNTSTDTVTTTGNVSFGASSYQYRFEHVQQLDSTRVAWLVNSSSTHYLNIATYAATPTGAQTSLATANLNNNGASIVHVGGGNILGISTDGATLFTTSGNTPTAASTVANYGNVLAGSTQAVGFAPGAANRATFAISSASNSVNERDYSVTMTPSGTTLPSSGPNAAGGFPSMPLGNPNLWGFIAGTSYCAMSSNIGGTFGGNIRVMRYTDAQLSEVAAGSIEGFPAGSASQNSGAFTKAAAVNGQACIAIGTNRSGHPQVFSMEVIKA